MGVDYCTMQVQKSLAFEEASKFFDMTEFPTTDDGNFGQLRRVQDVSQSIQRRVVAAEPQIQTELERLMGETPTTAGDVRRMEIGMRLFVHLYERATRSQTGSQEDYWCDKLCRHMIHAESALLCLNEATRSNIVRKIGDMMVLRRAGTNYTINTTWQEISCGFEEINGGSGENIFGTRPHMGSDSGGARVMVAQARAPLGDQNGRPTVAAPSKGQTAEEIIESQNA